jgi:hypothetical protein
MKNIFKALADRASDILENMMDRVNPEKVYLDCWGDNNRVGRLFAVGTIPSNQWDIYWVQNGSDVITAKDRIKTALSTAEMMQQMEAANRRMVISEKASGHYDIWLQRNTRRLAKQGIAPAPTA